MTRYGPIPHTRKLTLRVRGSLRLHKVLPPPPPAAGGLGARPVSSCCLVVPSMSSLRSRPSELQKCPSVPTARALGWSQSRRETTPYVTSSQAPAPVGPPPPPAARGGAARRGSGCRARNSQACQGGAGCERGAAEEASCDRRVLARVMHAWLSSHPPAPTSCRLPVAFLPSSRILPELARGGLHPRPPRPQLPPSRASFHL